MTSGKMNTLSWVILLVVIGMLAFGTGIYIRSQLAEERTRPSRGGGAGFSRNGPIRLYAYRAVELQLCEDPCEVALSIAGKRLLKSGAPALPLPGCRYKKCRCKYIQYDDRRDMQPRRDTSLYGVSVGKARQEGDRRKVRPGRRTSDRSKRSGAK
jgi:hypothetical protein